MAGILSASEATSTFSRGQAGETRQQNYEPQANDNNARISCKNTIRDLNTFIFRFQNQSSLKLNLRSGTTDRFPTAAPFHAETG